MGKGKKANKACKQPYPNTHVTRRQKYKLQTRHGAQKRNILKELQLIDQKLKVV